jgi:acetyltransferase-like isoleucine patch superfamily enzyme
VYITDQNHVYADVDTPIADQWPEEDPVTIGNGCWLGVGVIVLPGAHIGNNVAIAGGSIVRGVLPDRCVAAGAPAKVVRQYIDGAWDPPLREMSINPPAGWVQRSSSSGDGSSSG